MSRWMRGRPPAIQAGRRFPANPAPPPGRPNGMTMMKRILAPLDAREDSERIVPVVAALARDTGATVRLLRVFPVPAPVVGLHGRVVAYVDQEMERLTHEGLAELARVEAALAGVPVERVVRFGDADEETALEAEAFGADLIALTAARAGRLRRALSPALAERVAGHTPVPTLVLRG
ncbi:MAG TPA: universal stress protein [Methylomirabilota bacterium]|nr:universal stress protein [Methylomirabilota bacterium]